MYSKEYKQAIGLGQVGQLGNPLIAVTSILALPVVKRVGGALAVAAVAKPLAEEANKGLATIAEVAKTGSSALARGDLDAYERTLVVTKEAGQEVRKGSLYLGALMGVAGLATGYFVYKSWERPTQKFLETMEDDYSDMQAELLKYDRARNIFNRPKKKASSKKKSN